MILGDIMAKKNKVKRQRMPKIETSMDLDVKKLIIMSVIVLVCLGLFYGLTLLILKDDTKSNNDKTKTEIQFSEILLGSSFDQEEDKYLVLYYDSSDKEIASSISSLISTYDSKNSQTPLYTVDMADGSNSRFVSENGNSSATKASEMAIKTPTLILFNNHAIGEYIEGYENISSRLS